MQFHSRNIGNDVVEFISWDDSPFLNLRAVIGLVVFLAVSSIIGYRMAMFAVVVSVVRISWRLLSVREEALLVVRELGIQKRTKLWSGTTSHKFIDQPRIKSIIINEAFQMHRVIYYLGFIIENSPKLTLAFEHLIPRLAALRETYTTTRSLGIGIAKQEQ